MTEPVEKSSAENLHRLWSEAFEQDRFVLTLVGADGRIRARFTPTYDEAAMFINAFVLPFITGSDGAYQHNEWSPPFNVSMESEMRRAHYTIYARWRDIDEVEIVTETEEQRIKLDDMIREGGEWIRLKKGTSG